MDKLFNLDNWFFRLMEKIFDCMILNIFWIISSLPIITIGASTTALYYTVVKSIRKDMGSIRKEYWRTFFSNFKQSTIIWGFLLVLLLFIAADCIIIYLLLDTARVMKWILGVLLVILALTLVWAQYCFSYAAKFADATKVIMKNALYLLLSNLEKSIWIFALLAVSVMLLLTQIGPLLLLFFPTVSVFSISFITEKIYSVYTAKDDTAGSNSN